MIPKIVEEEKSTLPSTIGAKIDKNRFESITTDIGLIAICVIASFVSFWDVAVTFDSAFTVGWVSVLLYIVTTTVYRNKYDGGIYKGRQTSEYQEAIKAFNTFRNYVMNSSLTSSLVDWCNSYRTNDLEQVRKGIICPYMTYEEYQGKYQNISKEKISHCGLSKQAKKAVLLANSIRPLELSADMLLNTSNSRNLFGKRSALPMSGSKKRDIDLAKNYITKFIITFVFGMFAIQILSDPSFETFLQWLVRMFPVVMAFLTGEPNGYKNVVAVDVRRITAQTQLLKLFFADEKIDPIAAERSIGI